LTALIFYSNLFFLAAEQFDPKCDCYIFALFIAAYCFFKLC